MGDWADEKAEHALCNLCNLIAVSRDDIDTIAQALRQARLDALEEAAKVCLHEIEQPFDEWSSGYKDGCEETAAAIRALKEKQPK